MPHSPPPFRPHQSRRTSAPESRPSRSRRGYTRAWYKIRAHLLRDEPLCRHCRAAGVIRPAVDVDHIDNDQANNDPSNLQPLCKSCHSTKTNREDR